MENFTLLLTMAYIIDNFILSLISKLISNNILDNMVANGYFRQLLTFAVWASDYNKTENTQVYIGGMPTILGVSTHENPQVNVYPLISTVLGARITNRPESGGKKKDEGKQLGVDLTLHTSANAIIDLTCEELELYNEDMLEIVTDNSRWVYKSSFEVQANSILMRLRTPSGKGKFNCLAIVSRKDGNFSIDQSCFCGLQDYNPRTWLTSPIFGSVGAGHNRPFARQKRMVNGEDANGRTLHYLTSVLLHGTTPYCGATLVSQSVAVTSAFCVKGRNISDPNYILVGKNSFAIKKFKSVDGLEPWRIIKMITHPEYRGSYAHNIAVVRFNTKIDFERKYPITAYPACLPINIFGSLHGRWFTAVGWGGSSSKSSKVAVNSLKKVGTLEIKPVENCQAVYNFAGSAMENEHSLCMFASNVLDKTKNMTVCGIDAGGPIFYSYQNSRHVYLIGIIGESGNCDPSQPTMHTNVTHYLGWLSKTLNEENQGVCVK